ncbi:hypothetical protein GCM10023191_093460 [Actinoallomurus oryzae]|jgi:hypothetical protein|uniref:Uncharacterized protein n=1 Tax=Actinoallomurus oryzae TaxID=502180 RepID=A0ABP8R5M1_9ACTN|nr:hypothetical protein [Actinoallomurus sp. NBC_01490]
MSHLRKGLALILLALVGWLVAFGAVGAVSASASTDTSATTKSSSSLCC